MTDSRDDGNSGQGESGPADELKTRRVTEEAARTGRFPDEAGVVRDDSSPVEPEEREGREAGSDR